MPSKKNMPELWLKFLEQKFGSEGGQAKVQNTNLDSRDKHPKVEVFTLMKTDDRFRAQLFQEYRRWRQALKAQAAKGTRRTPIRMKTKIDMPQGARDLQKLLKDAGHELYLVGGAVRDHVLGKKPKDFDLATEAPPERIIDLLSKDPRFKDKLDLTGEQFGVVRVRDPENEEYEIATFRQDVGEGRRPDEVKFTTIDEDVARRDLTINALFYDMETGEVVDYVGGIEDAKKGIIKTVGRPKDRFREDKLRILRVVRFAGRMGAEIDAETSKAIKDDPALDQVSPERVRDEFVRGIASAKDPKQYLKLMEELGLFEQVFPGLKVSKTYLETPDPILQMTSLLRDNKQKDIEKVMRKMKYTRDEAQKVLFLLKMRSLDAAGAYDLKKVYKKLKLNAATVMAAARALGRPSLDEVKAFVNFAEAPPALTGKDLIDRGMKKGPEMGKAIAKAEQEAYEALLGD
jgi:tRNA nucleotidyltransferase/poly(A) polymerase